MSNQGNFKGVNGLCRQCVKECKQFENVKVVKCEYTPTLQARRNALEPITEGLIAD